MSVFLNVHAAFVVNKGLAFVKVRGQCTSSVSMMSIDCYIVTHKNDRQPENGQVNCVSVIHT